MWWPLFLMGAVALQFRPGRYPGSWWLADLVVRVAVLSALAVWQWRNVRAALDRRRARLLARTPGRPVAGIHPDDRPQWTFAPSDGSTEIEMRLRGRRYTAVFPDADKPGYRAAITELTATLNGGAPEVDVNEAFAARLGREPFRETGMLGPTLLDRIALRAGRR